MKTLRRLRPVQINRSEEVWIMKHSKGLSAAFALVVLSLALVLGPAPAYGQAPGEASPINKPTTITEAGSYILHRSFTMSGSATAIVVKADNVTLDLNGHTLAGPGNKQGIGILVDGTSGVHVYGGVISGFGIGVQVTNSNNVQLNGLQVVGRDLGGSPPNVEVGILILNSRAVAVKDNLVSKTFLGIFVRGGGSRGNRIVDNTLSASQNGQIGICYNPSPNAVVEDGPSGDLVQDNLITGFNTGITASPKTASNIFNGNVIAYLSNATEEKTANSNIFSGNTSIRIP